MRILLALVMLSVCIVTYAQGDSISASYDVDEVRITGVRPADDVNDIAPRYSLSASDFASLSVSDISSALRRLPGVTLRDYGGAGGMKTISVRGLGSGHVAVALDGLPLPDALSGQTDLQQFPLSEISGMTLTATGFSDIFLPARCFSKAATLNIETQQEQGVRAAVAAGSWGYWSPSASFARRIKRADVSFQGGYSQAENNYKFLISNGADTHYERRRNSATKQGYLSGDVLYRPDNRSSLRTTIRLSDNYRELPGIVRLYNNDNDELLRDKTLFITEQYRTSFSEKWRFRAAARIDMTEQNYRNGQPSGGIRSEHYLSREYYGTASVLFTPVRGLALGYSFDYWHDRMHTTLSACPRPRRNAFLQALSAKYAAGRLALTGQVLRSDVDKAHRLSPAFGASYRLLRGRELYIRLSAKDIFRVPTMTELYYYHLGTQTLRPEKTRQANLGLSFRRAPESNRGFGITASANVYINSVRDKIVSIPVNMFVYQYVNVGRTAGKGMDLLADTYWAFSPKQSIGLTVNYSLQDVKTRPTNHDFTPQQIAYTPRHSGTATLTWLNPFANISTTLLFVSATWATNEHNAGTRIAGYGELGASIYRTIRIKQGEMELKCTAQNILDKNYCIVAHYPMPGRNVNISITYKYN
ncbi:MAG: TonB-dependent receptor plug domain-containing protein [Prevotella sp.]|nr:TonB-dependent receptor plug domain-containing protein [Prevotella sp.]